MGHAASKRQYNAKLSKCRSLLEKLVHHRQILKKRRAFLELSIRILVDGNHRHRALLLIPQIRVCDTTIKMIDSRELRLRQVLNATQQLALLTAETTRREEMRDLLDDSFVDEWADVVDNFRNTHDDIADGADVLHDADSEFTDIGGELQDELNTLVGPSDESLLDSLLNQRSSDEDASTLPSVPTHTPTHTIKTENTTTRIQLV